MKKISLFMLMIFGLFILFAQEAPKEEPKNEAAAEAPASPVPTTMMSSLRLLAGFTNFCEAL